jgi:hypothetical protein
VFQSPMKIERVLTGFLIGWNIMKIFLSKETPIVSIGLRTAEVSYTNQNKTACKSEVVQTLGWPLPICVQTTRENVFQSPMKIERVLTGFLIGWNIMKIERVLTGFLICFSQSLFHFHFQTLAHGNKLY